MDVLKEVDSIAQQDQGFAISNADWKTKLLFLLLTTGLKLKRALMPLYIDRFWMGSDFLQGVRDNDSGNAFLF